MIHAGISYIIHGGTRAYTCAGRRSTMVTALDHIGMVQILIILILWGIVIPFIIAAAAQTVMSLAQWMIFRGSFRDIFRQNFTEEALVEMAVLAAALFVIWILFHLFFPGT